MSLQEKENKTNKMCEKCYWGSGGLFSEGGGCFIGKWGLF